MYVLNVALYIYTLILNFKRIISGENDDSRTGKISGGFHVQCSLV